VAGVHDAAAFNLDPGLQPVGEPEPVLGGQLLQVAEHLGWRRIVVGDAEPERQAVESLHCSLGDPRQRGDRGFDAHGSRSGVGLDAIRPNGWSQSC
jgi:hypothetical protein